MKIYSRIALIMALVTLVPAITASAQEINVQTEVYVDTQTSPSMTPNPRQTPPPRTLKAQMGNRIEANRDVRNDILIKKQEGRPEMKPEMRNATGTRATSTLMFKKDAKMTLAKKMEAKQFEMRKAALLKELNRSIENLESIAERTASRITKAESSGRTMTEAKAALVVANEKIAKAKVEVTALENFKLASSTATTSTNASTTAEVDLAKPRVIGDSAIKAVKEAREALQKVVTAIAHAMGLKEGQNKASTTPTAN